MAKKFKFKKVTKPKPKPKPQSGFLKASDAVA